MTAVCDEEIGGNSTLKTLLWMKEKEILNGEVAALIAEPSDRLVCRESLGFVHLKLEATRQSTHMGVAERKNNALYDIVKIIDAFPTMLEAACRAVGHSDERNKVIFNWGSISGGQDAAIPLGSVKLEGVIFLPEALNNSAFYESLLQEIYLVSGDVIKAEFSSFNFSGALSCENFIGEALLNKRFHSEEYHASPGLFPSPCDARLFKAFSVPVTIYGPGSLAQAHAINEHISLQELENYAKHCIASLWGAMQHD